MISQPSFCQSLELPTVPQAIAWTSGPAHASVGAVAEIQVPEGYQFSEAQAARTILEQNHNPVGKGLAGVLRPKAGSWFAILQYAPAGFVPTDTGEKLAPEALLQTFRQHVQAQNADRAKQGLPLISDIQWELPPSYDAASHSLEWAIRPEGTEVINYTLRWLGRHGILEAVVVRGAEDPTSFASLKKALQAVSFKAGERYTDYQAGDKLANASLAEVVSMDLNDPQTRGSSPVARALWLGLAVCGCAGVGGVVVLGLKVRRAKALHTPLPPLPTNGASIPVPVAKPKVAVATPVRPKARASAKPLKGHGHPRKRDFDYNRYFADLMSTVSSHGGPVESAPANGYQLDLNQLVVAPVAVNGHANGEQKAAAQSDILSSQSTLIEEQRRLIQEQSKLIEEKTKLIAEKNQLLKIQSELIDSKLV